MLCDANSAQCDLRSIADWRQVNLLDPLWSCCRCCFPAAKCLETEGGAGVMELPLLIHSTQAGTLRQAEFDVLHKLPRLAPRGRVPTIASSVPSHVSPAIGLSPDLLRHPRSLPTRSLDGDWDLAGIRGSPRRFTCVFLSPSRRPAGPLTPDRNAALSTRSWIGRVNSAPDSHKLQPTLDPSFPFSPPFLCHSPPGSSLEPSTPLAST
ncbi:hypothetical protein GQ53DRAFT_215255 [Thozetella sp. PMI_491]|nr:hypothetical protein GQ53DRAFT_215255 [Thozetella sp. PMI_491]